MLILKLWNKRIQYWFPAGNCMLKMRGGRFPSWYCGVSHSPTSQCVWWSLTVQFLASLCGGGLCDQYYVTEFQVCHFWSRLGRYFSSYFNHPVSLHLFRAHYLLGKASVQWRTALLSSHTKAFCLRTRLVNMAAFLWSIAVMCPLRSSNRHLQYNLKRLCVRGSSYIGRWTFLA